MNEDIADRMQQLQVAINDWSPMTMVDTYQQVALNMILFELTAIHDRLDSTKPQKKAAVPKANAVYRDYGGNQDTTKTESVS